MKNTNTTNKPTSRPEGFTKKDWDTMTIRAYNGLVMLVKGELPKGKYASMTKAYLYHPVVKELFTKCGIPFEEKQVLSLLFGMVREKTTERHIISVSGLRSWFNGGWKAEKPITYTTPKMPQPTTSKKSTKTKTKAKAVKEPTVDEIIKKLSDEQRIEIAKKIAEVQSVVIK